MLHINKRTIPRIQFSDAPFDPRPEVVNVSVRAGSLQTASAVGHYAHEYAECKQKTLRVSKV